MYNMWRSSMDPACSFLLIFFLNQSKIIFIYMFLFCDLHVVHYVVSLNENNGLNTSDRKTELSF